MIEIKVKNNRNNYALQRNTKIHNELILNIEIQKIIRVPTLPNNHSKLIVPHISKKLQHLSFLSVKKRETTLRQYLSDH